MNRKKELKQAYLQMKKDMGVYIVRSKAEKKCHVDATNDLKGTMNGARFKLEFGGYPNRELQKAYQAEGADAFDIEILELLPHDEKEERTDYSEDLEILKMIWKERMAAEGYVFYAR